MRQLSNKFTTQKKVNVFEGIEEETTSRRIYREDYELLRSLAFYEEKTINEVLFEVLNFVRPVLKAERYDELPFVDRPYKVVDSHKAVRIKVEDNELLAVYAKRQNMSIKRLISSCIKYYKRLKIDEKAQGN